MIKFELYLSRKEVAEILGLSTRSVDRLRKEDPSFPNGIKISKRTVRISPEKLREYINSRN